MNEWHPYPPPAPESRRKQDRMINSVNAGLSERPPDAGFHAEIAAWLLRRGQYLWALKNLQRALRLDPDHLGATMSLASFLATCPNEALRDGRAAVELAEKAYAMGVAKGAEDTEWMLRNHLTLLAAAYAQAGDWVQAVATQRRAIQCTCTQTHLPSLRADLAKYLHAQSVQSLGRSLGDAANEG